MERAGRTELVGVPPVKRNAVRRAAAGTPERRSTAARHDALSMERMARSACAWCRGVAYEAAKARLLLRRAQRARRNSKPRD